jgi:hypothetical protein
MTDHFPSATAARAVVDLVLRAWEIETDFSLGNGTIRFKFDRAHIIDRSPPDPSGNRGAALFGESALSFTANLTGHALRSAYPPPPPANSFVSTPEVQIAHDRWRAFQEGRDQLTSVANLVLTMLEDSAGRPSKRKKAASKFQIHEDVLNTVASLAATRGGPTGARKAAGIAQDLTPAERAWLAEAVKVMIRRMGQIAANAAMAIVKMTDLPPL